MATPSNSPAARVLLLADTHGYLDHRIAGLVDGTDTVVHAGDVGGRCVLEALGGPNRALHIVRGNNDTEADWGVDGAAELPDETSVDLPGGQLVVVHGHRLRARDRHARLRRAYPQATAVVYGHSHRLAIDQDALPWILNPGAAGRRRTYGGPSCLILNGSPTRWTVDAYRFEALRRKR